MGKTKRKPAKRRNVRRFNAEFLHDIDGFEQLQSEAVTAFRNASLNGDTDAMKLTANYFVGVVLACQMWDAFKKADRYRLDDRINVRAPGKVAGQNSVMRILKLTRNGVYARLEAVDLRPDDFGGLDNAEQLIKRSKKLQSLRSEVRKLK